MLLNKTLHVLAKKAIETTDHPYCSNMPMQRWIFVTPFSHVKLPEFVELLAYLLQCYPSYDYSSGILGSGPKEFWVANLPPKCQVMLKDLKQNELRMDMLFFWRRLPQTQITINWGSQWPLKICQTCFFKPVLLVLGESANLKSMSSLLLSSRIFIAPWKMNEYPWKGTISKGNFICQSILTSAC